MPETNELKIPKVIIVEFYWNGILKPRPHFVLIFGHGLLLIFLVELDLKSQNGYFLVI